MKTTTWLLATALLFITGCWIVTESKQIDHRPPATITVLNGKAVALDLTNFAQFRRQVMPLVEKMARKQVVSLGEGTHGTSEFYTVRYWITKILVEEKGFNMIAFENDYADSYLLDEALQQGRTDYEAFMKQHLLAIWRNQEVKELLIWMQTYNKNAQRPVRFSGLDMMFMKPDAQALGELTRPLNSNQLDQLAHSLMQLATFRDSLWYSSNRKDFTVSDTVSNDNLVRAYQTVDQMQQLLNRLSLPDDRRRTINHLIENVKLQSEGAYNWVNFKKGSGGRDSAMAVMAARLTQRPGEKLIIWAHNGHVARQGVYGGAVGGMGGVIERMRRGNYFVLGTGTARGTFAATDDSFITHASPMKSVALETPADSLWEGHLLKAKAPAFYFDSDEWSQVNTTLTNRVIGYFPDSGKNTHDKSVPLNKLYDAYLFIQDTKAAQFIK
ncbi:erythromycin esterase family protein [Spirosoma horti]